LAEDFRASAVYAIDSLGHMPARYLRGPAIGFRRVRVPRYPYALWYQVGDTEVIVLALTYEHMGQARSLRAINRAD
jgi:hypothetical protein